MTQINRGTAGSNPLYETSRFSNLHEGNYDKTRIQRMYQYPAEMKKALMHKKANEFGYNSKTQDNALCPCC
jgi:hypothetical protein